MSTRKILVPYNFAVLDKRTITFVIETFAGNPNVEVTLLHVFVPPPEIDTRKTAVAKKMKRNLSYFSRTINDKKVELEQVAARLREAGFATDRVSCQIRARRKALSAELVDAVREGPFDVVVLSHTPGQVSRLFKGNTFSQVVHALVDTTVCIVS